ncbi:hypothetical protein OH76DRAFT_423348 [Lentinus brumalis]|uniref:Phytocyanin domain-containing protein n=1 Tax=Lentinus brumalis TaxID=2498619 RepID=A0A371DWC9_9APHY|nr:hypothetical protein OH76DRAFT_423348 [Polyporus brumalis]
MATESSKSSSSGSGYNSGDYGKSSSSSSGDYGSSSGNYGSSSGNYGSSSGNYGSSSSSSSSGGDYGKSYDNSYSSSKDNSYSSTKGSYDSKSTQGSYESSSTQGGYDSKSTQGSYESSSTQGGYDSQSTAAATSTSSAYGSGYTNWGGSGYNDCVQQCVASYGAPPASWTPSSTQGSSNDGSYSGSKGSGATHTVIVAPTQGVLRYVPFAVNASVGDTVMFVWNAKNHTVTKSSALEICNKTSDAPFASGEHDAPFTFTQVVNDTNPTYFYCGTPGHCQKGMFGMINPPASSQAGTSVGSMMGSAVSNSSDMAAMMAYTNTMTGSNEKAASWGASIDMAALPEWAHSSVLENVMYTRAFLGANPETLKDDGFIDMSGDAPKMIPQDMAPINNAVDSGAATSSNAQAAPSGATSAAAAPSASASGKSNGAASKAASSAFLGVVALAAAVLAF